MTWTLIIVIFITNNSVSTYATAPIVIHGYKTIASCNNAAKEAIDNSKLAHLEAFCISGP